MQWFVWHKDQKAVCQCLTAVLNLANPTKTSPHTFLTALALVPSGLFFQFVSSWRLNAVVHMA